MTPLTFRPSNSPRAVAKSLVVGALLPLRGERTLPRRKGDHFIGPTRTPHVEREASRPFRSQLNGDAVFEGIPRLDPQAHPLIAARDRQATAFVEVDGQAI